MGKTEEDWNGLKLGFLKTVQPNSFSKLIPAACNFKNNAQETYLFVTDLWFCHLHVISLLTLSSIATEGEYLAKLNKMNWTAWQSPSLPNETHTFVRSQNYQYLKDTKMYRLWKLLYQTYRLLNLSNDSVQQKDLRLIITTPQNICNRRIYDHLEGMIPQPKNC